MRREVDRIDQFDGLRAGAFLAVFLHHAVHAPLMWMGVDLFFVLSGFLITRNLMQLRETSTTASGFGVFYFRRLLRIVPPYYMALTLIFIVGGWTHTPWFYLFSSNIHDSFSGPTVGPLESMWSIGVEEQFYLVWPLIVLLCPRRWLLRVFVAVLIAAPVFRLVFETVGFEAVYRLTLCRMDLLAAGAILAYVDRRHAAVIVDRRRQFATVACVSFSLFAVLAVCIPTFRTGMNTTLFNVVGFELSLVFFACLLAYVRAGHGPLMVLLRNPVLRYVGMISYMAYLLHMLAIDLVHHMIQNKWLAAPVALVLTVGAASASWFVVEKRLLKLRTAVAPVALTSSHSEVLNVRSTQPAANAE